LFEFGFCLANLWMLDTGCLVMLVIGDGGGGGATHGYSTGSRSALEYEYK
jgi:acetyl-CoA carboxylase alpha subunit